VTNCCDGSVLEVDISGHSLNCEVPALPRLLREGPIRLNRHLTADKPCPPADDRVTRSGMSVM
jgi:hypothetical protein